MILKDFTLRRCSLFCLSSAKEAYICDTACLRKSLQCSNLTSSMSNCSDALETATAWFKEEKEEDGGSTTGLLLGGNVCVDGATFASQTNCAFMFGNW